MIRRVTLMSSIDQLLNDIDEFENWPFDSDDPGSEELDSSEATPDLLPTDDLFHCILSGDCF